jgi:hypothetical protein
MTLNSVLNLFRNNAPSQVSQPNPSTEEEKSKSMFEKYGPNEVLFQWAMAGKINTASFNPKFIRMFMIIGIVLGILLALMQDFVLILVIGSTIFFYYTLHNKYSPVEINYEISKYGFKYGSKMYFWGDLGRFFFTKKGDQEILVFDIDEDLIGKLVVLFKAEDREKIFGLLKDKVMYLEAEPRTSIDKFVDFVTSKFNTDNPGTGPEVK